MKTSCTKCDSSDGVEVYEDHEFCFVCNTYNPNKERVQMDERTTFNRVVESLTVQFINDLPSYPINSRGISKEVVDYFDVVMSVDENGKPESHFYPYTNKDSEIVAYKERKLPKEFRIHGEFKGVELFGQSGCTGNRTLVITEGEIDCMSVAQAFLDYKGTIYPVVSLPSASGTASVLAQRDWINTFETVVLMLDQDEAGQKATDKIAKMIKAGKARVAKLPCKDPNETLTKHGKEAILRAIWDARPWNPAGIVAGDEIWEQFVNRQAVESVPYPPCLDGLNTKLKGIRQGEITLFIWYWQRQVYCYQGNCLGSTRED